MTSPDIRAQAEALLARLEQNPWGSLGYRQAREYLNEHAPAVIRALLEQVAKAERDSEWYRVGNTNLQVRIAALEAEKKDLQERLDYALSGDMPEHPIVAEGTIPKLEADLARLRAERDIWKGRAQTMRSVDVYQVDVPVGGTTALPLNGPWTDPTPAEIAARVAQNRRKEDDR